MVAMAVIHVGMSPQAGGRCHGEPKMSSPIRKPASTPTPAAPQIRGSLRSGCAFSLSSCTAGTLQPGAGSQARCSREWTPPENGGWLAFADRRRPSSIHTGIAARSAPAARQRPAAWRASGSSSSPAPAPSRRPATSARRSPRPSASWRSAPTAAACSSPVRLRHLARNRASPVSLATSIRSACGRSSGMCSSIAPGQWAESGGPCHSDWYSHAHGSSVMRNPSMPRGIRGAFRRRRPSSIHAGIASSSAPARRQSSAA